jgi:intein/homing endonuclease
MYDKIWNFKFLPPGRGLWMMGTEFIARHGSMSLNNCGFASTDDIDLKYSKAFQFVMDALMLGVGVGFDTKGAGKITIKKPIEDHFTFQLPDSREGWVESLKLILEAYFLGKRMPEFDFSLIRPAGKPIRGFGGIASGPEPLMDMLKNIQEILEVRIGQPIRSLDILDIMNLIGKCVVAGNVRRCIAEDQRVATINGEKNISDIKIGDLVLSSSGEYKKVIRKFDQGIQKTIKINTTHGGLKCTRNHRVAVYHGMKSLIWKYAKDLKQQDRLISIPHTKGSNEISPNYAWLIGFYIGDGCARYNKQGGGTVSFAMAKNHLKGPLGKKCIVILKKLGYSPSIDIRDNSVHINVYRVQLVDELQKYKKPNQEQIIPEFIWEGIPDIRAAFLAGLADADGGPRNDILYSKYPSFLKKIQKILLSLGIASILHIRPKRKSSQTGKIYEGSHSLKIRGIQSQILAQDLIIPYATRWRVELRKNKKNGLSLPYQIIIDAKQKGEINFNITASGLIRPTKTDKIGEISTLMEHGKRVQKVVPKYRDANFDTLIEKELVNPNWMPIEIISIEPAGKRQTYDIEVEDNHEFVCEGFLVHNSAEIALGEATDLEFIKCKQDKEKLYSHRWASNNSIFAKKGLDYSFIADQISVNGEPGILWLENAKAYSRMGNPPDHKDKKAAGVNPCITGDTLIAVADGRNVVAIKQLAEEGNDIPVYCKDDKGLTVIRMMRNPRITGYNEKIYEVKLDDDSIIKCTGNHKFFLRDMLQIEARDLRIGDSLMISGIPKISSKKITQNKQYTKKMAELLIENGLIYNHKVVSVNYIGENTVYNGTVDDFHNYGIVLNEKKTKTGRPKLEMIFTANCGEQTLESFELCCLVESFPSRHESYEEYQNTLKYAYLYAKSVTLVNTHWQETNAVMLKNRRMGISQTGIIEAFVKYGRRTILDWCDKGYKYIRELDEEYSDWLCVPKSLKITTVKPSGTVSLLPGVTPGIHYPHSEYYIRRIRISKNSDLIEPIKSAGYYIEDDSYSPNTIVVEFPVHEQLFERSKDDVSIWEQAENAADYQKYWSDNQVSITITFKQNEVNQIKHVLECFEDKLKSVSFLPIKEHGYKQAPYESITKEKFDEMVSKLKPLDLDKTKDRAIGSKFCDSESCEIKL